jgi:hypothetical protein
LRARPGLAPEDVAELEDLIRSQWTLDRRFRRGGWDTTFSNGAQESRGQSISFVNATGLIALYEASGGISASMTGRLCATWQTPADNNDRLYYLLESI